MQVYNVCQRALTFSAEMQSRDMRSWHALAFCQSNPGLPGRTSPAFSDHSQSSLENRLNILFWVQSNTSLRMKHNVNSLLYHKRDFSNCDATFSSLDVDTKSASRLFTSSLVSSTDGAGKLSAKIRSQSWVCCREKDDRVSINQHLANL